MIVRLQSTGIYGIYNLARVWCSNKARARIGQYIDIIVYRDDKVSQ